MALCSTCRLARIQAVTILGFLLVTGLCVAESAAGGLVDDGVSAKMLSAADNLNVSGAPSPLGMEKCWLFNNNETVLYNKIQEFKDWKTKLINYYVTFANESTNPLLNTTVNYKVGHCRFIRLHIVGYFLLQHASCHCNLSCFLTNITIEEIPRASMDKEALG